MDDAVSRYRIASATNDIEGMIDTLTPDAELISPLSGRMTFRGTDDLRILLAAIYGSLTLGCDGTRRWATSTCG